MIRKFKNFDADEFIKNKKALKEAVDTEESVMETPKENPDFPEEEVITGKAVYDDPYLLKIAQILWNKLKNIGNFGIYHDVVYLDDIPGVWFYGIDVDKNIVCYRNVNVKIISVFNDFQIGETNKAIVTYSTEKLGFKNMIDQLLYDLKNPEPIEEASNARIGAGYTERNIKNFEKLSEADKQYVYDFARTYTFSEAIERYFLLVSSKDPVATRILQAFIAPRGLMEGDGQSKYLMGFAHDVVTLASGGKASGSVSRAADTGVFDFLIKSYKGAGLAVETSYGTEIEVADVEAEEEAKLRARDAAREAEKAKRAKEYNEALTGITDMTEAMCNYVKNNGELNDDDASILTRRGMIITGFGGIGKTYNVKQVLKKKNMVLNEDYVWINLDETTSAAIYSIMYDFNGKLIVFDDAPKLFAGEYRIALWKNALQTDLEDSTIGYPKGENLNVYNVKSLKGDRQKQYYMEIGHKSDEDRQEFFRREMKRRGLKIDDRKTGANIVGVKGITHVRSEDGATDSEIQIMMSEIDEMWKEEQENTKPCMPNNFLFRGVVIIISNETRDKFIASMGRGNWDAIATRFENYDIAPDAEAIWSVIKVKILAEYNDKNLNDRMRLIPADMTEEFIDEVEAILAENPNSHLNWRTIKANSIRLRGKPGLRVWKQKLRDEMYGIKN